MTLWKLFFRIQQISNVVMLSASVLTGVGAYASNDITVASLLSIAPKTQDTASMLTPTLKFLKSSGNALGIQKVMLTYYASANCDNPLAGIYTTPDNSEPFPITLNTPFSLNSKSTYDVAVKIGLTNPQSDVHSVLVLFSNRNSTMSTGQAIFTGACNSTLNNCCVPIACSQALGTCTNNTGMESFPKSK